MHANTAVTLAASYVADYERSFVRHTKAGLPGVITRDLGQWAEVTWRGETSRHLYHKSRLVRVDMAPQNSELPG